MPSSARVVYDNAVYHIVQRGNNKQDIFKDEKDFKRFLSIIRRYIRKYNVQVYHYCLMLNHVHLLVKITRRECLAKMMQSILQSYRLYYGNKYGYVGHLYQGRFKSKLIEDDSYLLECGRYVERNPARAGLVAKPDEYPWSSCIFYTFGKRNSIITANPLYGSFGNSIKDRQVGYNDYISTPRPYEEIIDKEFDMLNILQGAPK